MSRIRYDKTRTGVLDLDVLCRGMPGITQAFGASLAEAATVCLEEEKHRSGVCMCVDGDFGHQVEVRWRDPANRVQTYRCWGDPEEATEHGAYAIAAALISEFTDFTIVHRSKKGTGFDFWLGKKGSAALLFQEKGRLEVSGIRNGEEQDIRKRLRDKIRQTQCFTSPWPGVVTIVEFGAPRSRIRNI